jgi:hypothetical protein
MTRTYPGSKVWTTTSVYSVLSAEVWYARETARNKVKLTPDPNFFRPRAYTQTPYRTP